MKDVNWYTRSLTGVSLFFFLYALFHMEASRLSTFCIVLVILIIMDTNPIHLPSGDYYHLGSIIFLLTLFHDGIAYSTISIFVGTFAYYVKVFKTFRISYFRFLVTSGMYILSVLAAFVLMKWSMDLPLFVTVGIATFGFELANVIILEGILKTASNRKMFTNIKQQLKEMVIPILVCAIVITKLLRVSTTSAFIEMMFYTLFFLLIVIFFSQQYTQQISMRQSTTKSFIQILEGRITSGLAGHGNRVGIICDLLLEDLRYPKKYRQDLVQAAVIHDIGKAFLPAYIFRKRGDLTLSEEREYESHPEKAVEIVKTMFPSKNISSWILHHHERWDGKGFPFRLHGEEIPLESRIIALCNELDHLLMRHEDPQTVLELLREKAGKSLDWSLVLKVNVSHLEMIREEFTAIPKQDMTAEGIVENESSFIEEAKEMIGKSYFVHVRNETLSNMPSEELAVPIKEVSKIASKMKKYVYDSTSHHKKLYDLHAFPLEDRDETIVFVQDTTPIIHYRQKLEQKILESYEEVIQSLSNEKIHFHSKEKDLKQLLGTFQDEMGITTTADIPKSRAFLDPFIKESELEFKTMKVQLAISEATTNLLKHATDGNVSVYKKDRKLQVLISDKGSGIPLHEIPKTILLSGYSSKKSLGKGFQMMGNFSNRLHVHTSSNGTSILIEFYYKAEEKEEKSIAQEKTVS